MCVHCSDVNKTKIKLWDQDQDPTNQTKTRPRLQDPDQDQNRSGVKPLPSECMSYKTVWQNIYSK